MTTASLHPSFVSAVNLLGGEGVLHARPRVVMDWIPLVRQGLRSASVDGRQGSAQHSGRQYFCVSS